MKELKLEKAHVYNVDYKNKHYIFLKGEYYRVPDGLADILFRTGDFVEILDDTLILEVMKKTIPKIPEVPKVVLPEIKPIVKDIKPVSKRGRKRKSNGTS